MRSTQVNQIDQLLVGFSPGDAISDYALWLQRVLRSNGHGSSIYARHFKPELSSIVRPWQELFSQGKSPQLLFHYSIGSDVLDALRSYAGRLFIIHHNVTPPEYYARVNPTLSMLQQQGIDSLPSFAAQAIHAFADSEYNATQLIQAGFPSVSVQPIPFIASRFAEQPSVRFDHILRTFRTRLLFVGRVAPNKRHDQLVRIAARYIRTVNRNACLILAGSFGGTETYKSACQELASSLGIGEQVFFTGHVSQGDLRALYETASAFLVTSDHEGFCVPLLEAMHFGLPIIAKRTTAIPETLHGSGILFEDSAVGKPELVELLHLIVTDSSLRAAVVDEQRSALVNYDETRLAGAMIRGISEANSTRFVTSGSRGVL